MQPVDVNVEVRARNINVVTKVQRHRWVIVVDWVCRSLRATFEPCRCKLLIAFSGNIRGETLDLPYRDRVPASQPLILKDFPGAAEGEDRLSVSRQ
jgi:hypothetical protein